MITVDVHTGEQGVRTCTVSEGQFSHVLSIETRDGFLGLYGTPQDLLYIADAIYARLGPSVVVREEEEEVV
jgi:hypothetical protein